MRLSLLLIPALLAATPVAEAQRRSAPGENRCGWLVNPTPANF